MREWKEVAVPIFLLQQTHATRFPKSRRERQQKCITNPAPEDLVTKPKPILANSISMSAAIASSAAAVARHCKPRKTSQRDASKSQQVCADVNIKQMMAKTQMNP